MQAELESLSRFVVGTEGNVSFRTETGFAIKQSGTSLKDGIFVHCLMDGKPTSMASQAGLKPSMEVSFHSFIYKHSDYTYIAHTHPVNTLKILCTNRIHDFSSKRLFPDQIVFNRAKACVVSYATPGIKLTRAIEKSVQPYSVFPSFFLLKNHGIICCGHSLKEVVTMTEICEKSAEIFLGCDNPDFLTPEQIQEIQFSEDEIYRKHVQ